MSYPARSGPSPEAIDRINRALVVLLNHEPMKIAEWSRACRETGMSGNDFKAVSRRCMGAELTRLTDGQLRLTQRGYRDAVKQVTTIEPA